jgi:hypothetical protein
VSLTHSTTTFSMKKKKRDNAGNSLVHLDRQHGETQRTDVDVEEEDAMIQKCGLHGE